MTSLLRRPRRPLGGGQASVACCFLSWFLIPVIFVYLWRSVSPVPVHPCPPAVQRRAGPPQTLGADGLIRLRAARARAGRGRDDGDPAIGLASPLGRRTLYGLPAGVLPGPSPR